ncbi:MAG: outer membrane beta-barrel protein [Dysgonamonadaceae bacterium]|jgi:hypothetical protein|nr:outer membrane beta-barrel protein [Dysgonamonadaceae bacterium]
MKQVLMILAVALFSVATVSAQDYKPAAGSFGLEVGISPLQLGGGNAFDSNVTGIYTLSDKLAVRLNLGITTNSGSFDNGESGNAQITANTSNTSFSITPGIVYSFAGTQKLTPYIGAELGLALNSIGSKGKVNDITTTISNSNGSNTTIGFGVFSGINYYIAQHVYIGVEIGLAGAYVSVPNQKTEYSGTGAPQNPAESKVSQSSFTFSVGAYPFLRLGWSF